MSRAKKTAQEAVKRARETRKRLEEMKTIPDLMKEADAAFCAFIRERDKGLPCICCGRTSNGWTRGGEWDGGHFRSRGAASHLRYDERNCHAQLKQCNRRAWDVATYEANLIAKIGREQVEDLKADNRTHKWTRDELRGIRADNRARLKALRAK